MGMGFLAKRPAAAVTATPGRASAPAQRDPNRYAGLRTTTDTAKLYKGDYGIEILEVKQEQTRAGAMWICKLQVHSAAEGSTNSPGQVELARPAVTADHLSMIAKLCLGMAMAAAGCVTEAEFFEAYQADEKGEGAGADLIDRLMGFDLPETTFGPNPLASAKIRVEAFNATKIDPKTGQPYVNLRFYPDPEAQTEAAE